jgi:hypothetical protein
VLVETVLRLAQRLSRDGTVVVNPLLQHV